MNRHSIDEALATLDAAVRPYAERVSRRGQGFSPLLFIESGGRAAEASRHRDAWWLGFRGSEALPVRELTAATTDDAVAAIREWLGVAS